MDDEARFALWYRDHGAAVARYVGRRCDPQAVDDVVADVFVVAWRRRAEVPADVLPWLLGVARRLLANRRRADAREFALRARIRGEALTADAVGRDRDAERRAATWEALRALKDADREILLLVAWEGLAPARAARVLGISANTCSVRLYRARRRFRRALAAHEPSRASTSTVEVMR